MSEKSLFQNKTKTFTIVILVLLIIITLPLRGQRRKYNEMITIKITNLGYIQKIYFKNSKIVVLL